MEQQNIKLTNQVKDVLAERSYLRIDALAILIITMKEKDLIGFLSEDEVNEACRRFVTRVKEYTRSDGDISEYQKSLLMDILKAIKALDKLGELQLEGINELRASGIDVDKTDYDILQIRDLVIIKQQNIWLTNQVKDVLAGHSYLQINALAILIIIMKEKDLIGFLFEDEVEEAYRWFVQCVQGYAVTFVDTKYRGDNIMNFLKAIKALGKLGELYEDITTKLREQGIDIDEMD
jgi:hypothetical protein